MATYQRRTRIEAPLSEVWGFHSRIDGLTALTPGWMNMRVERIVGPDGEESPETLLTGSRIDLSVQLLGIAPRQSWTSVIDERTEGEGWARFRDTMEDGPFDYWRHTHQFFGDGEETVLIDEVEYELPVAKRLGPFAVVGFEPMFRYRHQQTGKLLE
jgi:ligand-binding SRPBCC domain-containing protein